MLHARIDMVQILDRIQVGAEITEYLAGQDPTVWTQRPLMLSLEEMPPGADALTIMREILRLWSEMTISE